MHLSSPWCASYSTGLTELRGHVANWYQGGPQFVRDLPVKVGDAGILLIRRFPKDPQRKQRLPFIVSRRRLEAALKQLCKPVDEGGHRAYQKNAWPNGGIRVSEANLAEYDDEGAEPAGLQVITVDQREGLVIGAELFAACLDEQLDLHLNIVVRAYLQSAVETETEAEWPGVAWEHVRAEVQKQAQERSSLTEETESKAPQRPRARRGSRPLAGEQGLRAE